MCSLSLPICLRVVTAREYYPGAKELPELLPKAACEAGVSIMQDLLRHTKQDNYVLKKQPRTLLGRQRPLPHRNRDQAHKLGQAIHNGENPSIPRTTRGKVSDEVHAPAVEAAGRDWEWL